MIGALDHESVSAGLWVPNFSARSARWISVGPGHSVGSRDSDVVRACNSVMQLRTVPLL